MKDELNLYIRARYSLLWVVTPEERRALATIEQLATEQKKRLLTWSSTVGQLFSVGRYPLQLAADPCAGCSAPRDGCS